MRDITGGRRVLVVGALALLGSCAGERLDDERRRPSRTGSEAESPSMPARSYAAADPDSLLPSLPEYATDDEVDAGELRASLDDGSIPYADVRRRLILDEQGFTSGEVAVVTFDPEEDVAERNLTHQFGNVPREPIDIAGEEMIRVATEPFPTVAWPGPGFLVTFRRGQERSDEWLEELVRATVRGVAGER
jgi:hypothetical protein